MGKTVEVTIPVEQEAAEALADARNRDAVSRLISRVLRRGSGPTPLSRVIVEMKADARAAGLNDADIDAELVAYKPDGVPATLRLDRLRCLDRRKRPPLKQTAFPSALCRVLRRSTYSRSLPQSTPSLQRC